MAVEPRRTTRETATVPGPGAATRIQFSSAQGERIREAVAQIKNHADSTLRQQLSSAVGQHAGLPRQLTEFLGALADLEDALAGGAASIPEAVAPVLATVAAYYRRTFVTDLEERRARALAGELLQNLDAAKASVDALLTSEWYLSTTPLRLPRLRDFVAESRLVAGDRPKPPPRHLDDKFGVLWSASDLLRDLSLMREECGERFAPVSVAFADVDGLKALNSALGETWVDALILPPLMRCVERAVFGHGYAYRYGGDEFALLIPSGDREVALAILRHLRDDLARTIFESVPNPPTISIGLCVLHPDSPLTDREALHWAALAKRGAKTVRNAIAVVAANREIDKPQITVLSP
jgi:diguanylate cyclase (GGDEF)-like protein